MLSGENADWWVEAALFGSKAVPKCRPRSFIAAIVGSFSDLFRTLIELEKRLNHFLRIRQDRFLRFPHRSSNRTEQPDLSGNASVDKSSPFPSPQYSKQSKPITILQTPSRLAQIAHSPAPDTSSHVLPTQSPHQSTMSGTVDKPIGAETVCHHHASTLRHKSNSPNPRAVPPPPTTS